MKSIKFGGVLVISLLGLLLPKPLQADGEKILVFKDSASYGGHTAGIASALSLIRGFGTANGFTVDTTIHLSSFNTANLTQYSAAIILYPEPYNKANPATGLNDTMSADQDSAFKSWILSGKGVVGVHPFTRFNNPWEWWVHTFVGLRYVNDIGPQNSKYHVADTNEFLTKGFPKTLTDNQQLRVDSIFFTEADTTFKVLIRADSSDYPSGQLKMAFYPYVYRHNYQGGRFFGFAPGHNAATWNTSLPWNNLLLNGILYALGRPGYAPAAVRVGPAPAGYSLRRLRIADGESVRYGLPQPSHVVIRLFDLEGRLLAEKVNENLGAGSYTLPLPAGLRGSFYVVDFTAGNYHKAMKMTP